ncbi:hypothetical protein FRB99_007574 [Tulasnella sp. 403]|nr:hypothetical protein FRB99_007574 [Tulasnella sp. 403]
MASTSVASPVSPAPTSSPSRFKRVLKRLSSFRIFPSRAPPNPTHNWPMIDTDYMYDDDIDVSYEGLLSLAARIGDAKPRNLPAEFKATLPRSYEDEDKLMGIDECAHFFHAHCFEVGLVQPLPAAPLTACLQRWLDLASNCPVCRRELTPDDYRYDPSAAATSSSPISAVVIEESSIAEPSPLMDEFGLSSFDNHD